MNKPRYWSALILTLFLAGLVSGCASTGSISPDSESNDPFERANRSILKFNLESDRLLLKPIAKTYDHVVPEPVQKGINNFFSNLWEPMTVVNDLLQGKVYQAVSDTTRFFVNTTFGVLGIFDVATSWDIPKHKEDFGQTLAKWGVPSGPYLMLPFLGPSNIRDTAGLVPQYLYADALLYLDSPDSLYASGLRLVDTRSLFLDADEILELQPDKYLFLRAAYRQLRRKQIYDGNPPHAEGFESDDDLLDQLLEE